MKQCCVLLLILFLAVPHHSIVFAQNQSNHSLPAEYYPDPHLSNKMDTLVQTIVTLQATTASGKDPDSKIFATLHTVFADILRYFPQSPQQQIIYEQCNITTADLSQKYEYNTFLTFKEKCLGPINSTIGQIKQGGTIKTEIVVTPKEGPAPLNVTLDARNSIDPSNDTIPSDNFYRYYKDTDGNEQIIGKGVIVNHTFRKPGNYIIHLTVRSVNNLSKGVFDGTNQTNVNVGPQIAKFGVYVNGVKSDTNDILRIGAQEALNGVIIDGGATVPIGGRTITTHSRKISGENKFELKKDGEGPPSQFSTKFPRNGSYKLELEITDNQNNKSKESYQITVSDPVANIKYSPRENGNTSQFFNFDAGASYSLTSKIAKYQWLVTDPEGNTINNEESKSIKRKFAIPGWYTAKLTVVDELGNSSFDSEKFYVNSTPPVAVFTVRPFVALKQPSQFVLDASASFDEDVRQGTDALLYKRSFTPQESLSIEKEIDGGKQVIITAQQPGTYKAKLTVTDQFGQSTDIDKDIKVDSSLRPSLTINPVNVQLGNSVDMSVEANKNIALIEWDFGDGTSYKGTESTAQKEYKKSGVFVVKVKVSTLDGESNEISKIVFIGQKDTPSAAFEVFNQTNQTMEMIDSCLLEDGTTVPAYRIDRYESFSINAQKSTDTQGGTSKLKLSLKASDDAEISNKGLINYNFKEMGCHSISVYAEDVDRKVTDTKLAYFHVYNALPRLDRLDISFPQQSSAKTSSAQGVGIAGSSNTQQQKLSITEILADESIDNVIVKLQAQNIKDPDGFLSHLVWYYYRMENPEKLIEAKVTPGSVQFVNFSIPKPRQPGEFGFGVKLVDNDKGEITSEEVLGGKGPSLFFPTNANNPDIPLVTVKTDKSVAKVGDEITVTADSSILSNRSDFEQLRYFKYDFDGDGSYDLTSKNTSEKRKFAKSGSYSPKVAVYYRERLGIGWGDEIQIQQGLQAIYEVAVFDKKVLMKDFSIGDIESRDICMDIKACAKDPAAKISNKEIIFYEYPQYDNYLIKARIVDKYGNLEGFSKDVSLAPTTGFGILSIPQAQKNSSGYSITLGNNINNEVNLYVASDPKDTCFIDTDITSDSDNDGDPTNDLDRTCNQLLTKQFFPKSKQQYASILITQQGETTKHSLTFEFLDIIESVPEEYKMVVAMIDELLLSLDVPSSQTGESKQGYVRELLVNLKKDITEKDQVDSILLQVNDLLQQNASLLNQAQSDTWTKIMQALSNSDVKASLGLGVYELNKQNILAWFSDLPRQEVQEFFKEFEMNNGNKQAMKLALDKIGQKAVAELQAGNIDSLDMNYIKKALCEIVIYYELPAKSCDSAASTNANTNNNSTVVKPVASSSSSSGSSWLSIIIKVLLGIGLLLLLVFVVFFVIGVVKAKKAKAQG